MDWQWNILKNEQNISLSSYRRDKSRVNDGGVYHSIDFTQVFPHVRSHQLCYQRSDTSEMVTCIHHWSTPIAGGKKVEPFRDLLTLECSTWLYNVYGQWTMDLVCQPLSNSTFPLPVDWLFRECDSPWIWRCQNVARSTWMQRDTYLTVIVKK